MSMSSAALPGAGAAGSRAVERPEGAESARGIFPPRWRRAAVVYVGATLPLIAVAGIQVDDREAYLRAFVFVAGGLYATPALLVGWLTIGRVAETDRWRWRMWFAGVVVTFLIGEGILIGLHTSTWPANPFGPLAVTVSTLLLMGVAMDLVRTRSGRLALSVDLTECAMVLVVVTAPAVLLWGDDIVSAHHSWYAVPATVATVGSLAGFYWTSVLYVRLRGRGTSPGRRGRLDALRRIGGTGRAGRRRARGTGGDGGTGDEPSPPSPPSPTPPVPLERAALRIGLALTFLGAVDGAAQVAQGVSGFDLPSGPVIVVHGMCTSMLLLFPLFQPSQMSPGYQRLPPQAQVRGAGLAPLLTLAGLPVLLVATVAERDRTGWAAVFSLTVVGVLAVLAVLRQLVGIHETRRLYVLVERASEERRDLLARLIQQMSADRHTVAAQLHEQAMSAYATFATFSTTRSHAEVGSPEALSGASRVLRDDLARQAESLRELMLAIRPMAMERSPSESLAAPIRAYLDSLYGDAPAPELDVTVDDDIVLDWITETIVSRIVQEATHNVWRHSSATRVRVAIGATRRGQVEVRVTDDGTGFDPRANLFESGIAAMRSFAAFTQGSLDVDSTPGAGTTVTARLGEPRPAARATPAGW